MCDVPVLAVSNASTSRQASGTLHVGKEKLALASAATALKGYCVASDGIRVHRIEELSTKVEKTYSLRGNVCYNVLLFTCGPGSIVGIATGYGLDGLKIESRWGRDFSHLSRAALGPTQPPVQWVPGLSRGKRGWRVKLIPHLF